MINKTDKSSCTGCTACASICPKKCIVMVEDEEGFDYPKVDTEKCIDCSLCEKVCVVGKRIISPDSTYTIAFQNKNENIRENSSAGGAVGAIFAEVFNAGGVAYGAGYDKDNIVRHMRVTSMLECKRNKIFASKYVTSDLGETFAMAKNDLATKPFVCFVGLPCQIAGLKSYLKIEYPNLITIDLTCYGVPSRRLYREYISHLEDHYSAKVVDVRFRDKSFGYSAPTMFVEFSDGKSRSQNRHIKSYLRAFFSNISMRPSCYKCSFKGVNRISDFTIGDCKNIKAFVPSMDDDKGTTVMYVHTEKAKQLLNRINDVIISEVPIDEVLKTCGRKMSESATENPVRENFFADINSLSYEKLIRKYCPASLNEIVSSFIKEILLITGLNRTSILRKLKRR